jgi:hypothetical protein
MASLLDEFNLGPVPTQEEVNTIINKPRPAPLLQAIQELKGGLKPGQTMIDRGLGPEPYKHPGVSNSFGDPSLGTDEYGRPLFENEADKKTNNLLLRFR